MMLEGMHEDLLDSGTLLEVSLPFAVLLALAGWGLMC